ncbi:unnamed protein product [Adineta steineri]|uniref:Ig-like domain-containing protein n=2 Tax=Adineta steineri TaxID=433720 RepID=A0A815G3B8_9BILA|nr:unnamed protein product [Adineta steineri]CAF3658853.1 unnamed protein product [Adineta steineri]
MYSYDNIPTTWFRSNRRGRIPYNPSRMSQPVSKSFNRISDFIFPDTIHIHMSRPSLQQFDNERYGRTDHYNIPASNRPRSCYQPDLIIVERLPADELDNIDLLYHEQHYQTNRQLRRRYSSIIDDRRMPPNEKPPTEIPTRPAAFRERIRDRRKRHTTDNAYHSILKSMLDLDELQECTNDKGPNCILSYRTTLEPITDSESMTSIHQQPEQQKQQQQQEQHHVNNISHCRVPINGTAASVMNEYDLPRHRQFSSTISSRGSTSDTDTVERHSLTTMNYNHNLQTSPRVNVSNICRTPWKRHTYKSDGFFPIHSSITDTDKHKTMSYSNNLTTSSPFDNINNQSSSPRDANHVSVCVNDLHTTLFIDEDTLNNTKTTINNTNNNGDKAVIKTFIDRIIKRLQHFKRSLDNGLISVRKRNTLTNGSIVTTNHQSRSEMTKRKSDIYSSLINDDENKYIRPYFLIKPQTVLVLPNETAKFKCCFGGEPFPNVIWSHNNSRISDILATNSHMSSKYRIHKLHDIYYLDIDSINFRDSGEIKCTITNRMGREETIVQLLVVCSPTNAIPCIIQPLNDMIVIEGRPLTLTCSVKGLQVTINWFHNGKLVSSGTQSKNNYIEENAIFTLTCCMRNDAGTVDCIVKNRFGEARTSCRIEVVNDPAFDR